MRILALDVGDRRTGVALSDPLGLTAQGLCVIEASGVRSLVEQAAALIREHEVSRVVVGVPLNMDGSAGERALKSRKVIEMLRSRAGVEVDPWDERLTTLQAERTLIEADVSRRRRKEVIDKMSAVLILQAYLDRTRAAPGGAPRPGLNP
ncbi:MAG: Holliday junction resolvase RuvX [Firmicutes bacterium]|nr:Holliday junction resolvase RuvX [Bacillota bacterium]